MTTPTDKDIALAWIAIEVIVMDVPLFFAAQGHGITWATKCGEIS
jgi:hypothetical protein